MCDLWGSPALLGSWHVLPHNSGLDWAALRHVAPIEVWRPGRPGKLPQHRAV